MRTEDIKNLTMAEVASLTCDADDLGSTQSFTGISPEHAKASAEAYRDELAAEHEFYADWFVRDI